MIMKQKDEQNDKGDITKNVLALSMKRAFALTLLVYCVYNYQQYVSSFNNNHKINSFLYLFVLMTITITIVEVFTPNLSTNLMSGIGWGVGAALLNKILSLRSV